MEAMENSTGALSSAYDEYYSSIQTHVNSFKASFESLSKTIVNSNLAKGIVDIGAGALNFLDGIASRLNVIGGIAPILTGLFSMLLSNNWSKIASTFNLANLFNPANLKIGVIIAGITALASAFLYFKNIYDEAHPTVENLKQDLADIESTSRSLQAERDKNKTRIGELEGLSNNGLISQVEQKELDYLTQRNDLLDKQIQLEERLAKKKREEVEAAAKSEAHDWLNSGWHEDVDGNTVLEPSKDSYGALLYAIGMYKRAKQDFDDAVDDDAKTKAMSKMLSAEKDITTLTGKALSLRASIVDAESEEAIALDGVINQANSIIGIFDHGDFNKAFEELPTGIVREFGEEADITAEQVEQLANRYGLLKRWMEENGYTAEDVAVQFNRMRAETAETSTGVEELTDDVTNLSGELGKAAEDLEAYSNATSGEKGDVADKYGAAYKKFLEDWNSGKTGSNAVKAAVDLFIPEETLRDLDYDLTAAGELLASDMYQAIFNTEGDYGENFANYIKDNFDRFKDVASIIDNGDGTFDFAYDSLSGLAEAFGLSENAVTALLDSLDKYGVQAMMSAEDTRNLATELGLIGPNANTAASNVERVMTAITGLAQQGKSGTEIRSILDSLASAGYIDISGIDGLGDKIAEAVEAVNDADGETATATIDADISGVESGTARAQALINSVHGKTVSIGVQTQGYAGGHASRASGGLVPNGGKTLVNELGPELISENGQAYIAGGGRPTVVDLSPGAIVLDAETSKRAMRGGAFKGVPIKAAARTNLPTTDSRTGSNNPQKKIDEYLKKKVNDGTLSKDQANSIRSDSNSLAEALVNTSKQKRINTAATVPSSSDTSRGGDGGSGGGGSSSESSDKGETWFEKQLAEHKHLVEMDKESQKDYLDWLDGAYKKAYDEGIIDLKEYRQHEEEVYKGRQNDFKDHISDTEHLIELEKNGENNPTTIYNLYVKMMGDIEKELKKCYDDGLDETNEYVQYLQNSWNKYNKEIEKQQEDANDAAKKQVKDLVDYRIKMLKQYLKNEIQNLNERLSNLKDFNSKQKELLQEARDEEKYLDDQSEKRSAVSSIQAELKQLESDTSARAQMRKLKLQKELEDAQKTLDDFEKDHALKVAQDQLDAIYETQEKDLNAQIKSLQAKLDDPQYLYERALKDVQNNSVSLYEEMIEFNNRYGSGIRQDIVDSWEEAYISLSRYHDLYGKYYKGINLVNATGYVPDSNYNKVVVPKKGYASGTSYASPGLHRIDELGAEAVFTSRDGSRYRMLSAGDKVLNADATGFLYNFAENGRKILAQLFDAGSINGLGLVGAGGGICEIRTGDIIIQGNTDDRTVSEIRRAQRDGLNTILKEFKRLKK